MNTNNSCSCCPPDSNQVVNGNIYSKVKAPNKAKIKTASRILKKLNFKVLGTVSEEQAMIDRRNRDLKVEYIPVSSVNSVSWRIIIMSRTWGIEVQNCT